MHERTRTVRRPEVARPETRAEGSASDEKSRGERRASGGEVQVERGGEREGEGWEALVTTWPRGRVHPEAWRWQTGQQREERPWTADAR